VRVRKAASLALDCKGINDALTLGFSEVTGNSIVPKGFDSTGSLRFRIRSARAKKLLAEQVFPAASTLATISAIRSYANVGEIAVDNLLAVGIRSKLRPIERAAFIKEFSEKKYRNIIQAGRALLAMPRLASRPTLWKGGVFSYGSYPDIDELYASRRASWTGLGARPRCSRFSSSWSSARSMPRSGSSPYQWHRSAGGRVRLRPDSAVPLYGTL